MPQNQLIEPANPMQQDPIIDYRSAQPASPPAQQPWWAAALGNDFNRLMQTVQSGLSAPLNALTGQYDTRVIDPQTGAVEPMNRQMIGDAGNMAALATTGSIGAVPADALGMGIKAYHGSPHSFDKFDMSKIGSGDGGNVFGHGLYFAENEGTAKAYAASSGLRPITKAGEPIALSERGPDDFAARSIFDAGNDIDEGIAGIEELASGKYGKVTPADATLYRDAIKTAKEWKKNGVSIHPRGSTYAVDINAHPSDFLDANKPLSAQPKNVRDALVARGIDLADPYWWNTLNNSFAGSPEGGSGSYSDLSSAASGLLKQLGAKGLKYFDDPAHKFHNYVLFDDNLVNIEKKYGLVGGAPANVAGPVVHPPADPAHPVLMELRT